MGQKITMTMRYKRVNDVELEMKVENVMPAEVGAVLRGFELYCTQEPTFRKARPVTGPAVTVQYLKEGGKVRRTDWPLNMVAVLFGYRLDESVLNLKCYDLEKEPYGENGALLDVLPADLSYFERC